MSDIKMRANQCPCWINSDTPQALNPKAWGQPRSGATPGLNNQNPQP
ncbi:MAG: hypothetical protein ACI8P0_000381 [Planctomycetaceae bacterium]|jgi:hypothetical protein